jgi:hypothetical protein
MKLYHIIGLRDISKECGDEFQKLLNNENKPEEIDQICNGYTNPLIVANIINCRTKCLSEKE